jgi:hypothetical protein
MHKIFKTIQFEKTFERLHWLFLYIHATFKFLESLGSMKNRITDSRYLQDSKLLTVITFYHTTTLQK